MRNLPPAISLVVVSLFSAAALSAQTTTAIGATVEHAPDPGNGTGEHVNGIFIPLIAGQPFQARIPVEVTRNLPDGTTVTQKYYTRVARDSAGRTYREGRDIVPADSNSEPPLMRSMVYDPKTSLVTVCYPLRRTCQHMTFVPNAQSDDVPPGPSGDGKSVLTREGLGTKTMDGLQVMGTRETTTFEPGGSANDQPLVVTNEFWYSPQLQFNLSVTRIDPREGTQKLEVADLKLGEPDAAWFQMPDGYRLVVARAVTTEATGPAELAPLLKNVIAGMSADELATALAPVEAAIGTYAKAHAAATPNDKNDAFASQIRMHLSSNFRMLQGNPLPKGVQPEQLESLLNQVYRQVLESPCFNKPAPGDPPTMPGSEVALREEEQAWIELRDAWVAFLAKLYPNGDKRVFAWVLTGTRLTDLRSMEAVERNRGCLPEESMEPLLQGLVNGMTPEQLSAALKPVDSALNVYARAHAESVPNDRSDDLTRKTEQTLAGDLRTLERNQMPTLAQFEEADLHLNQTYRVVIASRCLGKTIPDDLPDVPVSVDKLRAEERAWIQLRDAWSGFLATVFPAAPREGLGTALTKMRTADLREIQSMELLRGCKVDE